jgi:hypothetical protein
MGWYRGFITEIDADFLYINQVVHLVDPERRPQLDWGKASKEEQDEYWNRAYYRFPSTIRIRLVARTEEDFVRRAIVNGIASRISPKARNLSRRARCSPLVSQLSDRD